MICGAAVYRWKRGAPEFLILKTAKGWGFASGKSFAKEKAHETAERILFDELGISRFRLLHNSKKIISGTAYFVAETRKEPNLSKQYKGYMWLRKASAAKKIMRGTKRILSHAAAYAKKPRFWQTILSW